VLLKMFSFSPFDYQYGRPKSYSLFDEYDPFSSGYYVREQPSVFSRSSSFRQPSTRYQNYPTYQSQTKEEEDEYDPFLDLFSLRNRRSPKHVPATNECKQTKSQEKQVTKNQVKSAPIRSQSSVHEKELDSQRYDTENEIEYRFNNYKCNDPSAIDIKITKDGYIVLRTNDGYVWKNKLPLNVEVEKASCTCLNKCLSLKLPIKKTESMEVQKMEPKSEAPKTEEVKSKSTDTEMKTESKMESKPSDSEMKTEQDVKSESKPEEIDPDAPIVEDIIEED